MKPPILRASLGFTNLPDNSNITFARNVHGLLYALGIAFPDLPVSGPVLLESITSFASSKAAQSSGGKAATAEKNNRRNELNAQLKKLALYVQEACNNNLALLLSTGFEAVSTNRASYPLAKPSILRIVPGMTGESRVTLSTERNSRGTEVRVAEVNEDGTLGPFRPILYSTSSRNIGITDLIPGKLYAYQGRNVGGSTTYSDWSDLLVHRAA
ncbi:MAG: hypothetical protein V4640_03870 [Verrucomicrobiota bacterium]